MGFLKSYIEVINPIAEKIEWLLGGGSAVHVSNVLMTEEEMSKVEASKIIVVNYFMEAEVTGQTSSSQEDGGDVNVYRDSYSAKLVIALNKQSIPPYDEFFKLSNYFKSGVVTADFQGKKVSIKSVGGMKNYNRPNGSSRFLMEMTLEIGYIMETSTVGVVNDYVKGTEVELGGETIKTGGGQNGNR